MGQTSKSVAVKDEAKPPVLGKVILTPAQSAAIDSIDAQFKDLQRQVDEATKLLSARENGMVTGFLLGSALEKKQWQVKKDEKGQWYVEEVVPAKTADAATSTVPTATPAPTPKDKP